MCDGCDLGRWFKAPDLTCSHDSHPLHLFHLSRCSRLRSCFHWRTASGLICATLAWAQRSSILDWHAHSYPHHADLWAEVSARDRKRVRAEDAAGDSVAELRRHLSAVSDEQAAASQRLARIEAMLRAFVQQAAELSECRRELLEARLQLAQVRQRSQSPVDVAKPNSESVLAEVHRLLASIGAEAPDQVFAGLSFHRAVPAGP